MTQGNRILVVIGGGIAAYKSLELIRLLRQSGFEVFPVLTEAGTEFVTPLSVAALAGNPVSTELFNPTEEARIGHIALSRNADLVVVAPATADLMAKMANGLADDLASTLLLATDKKVLLAPAMNVRMWLHNATQRNVRILEGDGVQFAGPDDGDMACGEFGPGRMAEPQAIFDRIGQLLAPETASALKVVITSGPTREAIDPVRFIANRSSGKQGAAIAEAFIAKGANVVFVTGPSAAEPGGGAVIMRVESAREMLDAVKSELPADVAVFAAAVADWRVASESGSKIKKHSGAAPLSLDMVENPDILATVSKDGERPRLVVGFAAETENLLDNARAKLKRKGCDWIVANNVGRGTGTLGGDNNEVHLITSQGSESWPRMSKQQVAIRLVDRVVDHLNHD